MPHASVKLIPGVDTTKTPALNEAAISESQLIRFVPDRTMGALVQKLGGWTKYFNGQMGSAIKNLWAWEDTNSNSYLAVGCEGLPANGGGALQIIESGSAKDITPQTTTRNIAVSFSTTAGSNEVYVTDTGSNVSSYDVVNIQNHISVGGIILFGQYQCFSVGPNTYRIYPLNLLNAPYNATSTVVNGGSVAVYTAETGSAFVDVTLADHNFTIGNTYSILIATSIGGITLYGNYDVVGVKSSSVFTILVQNVAGSLAVTGASGTGATATLTYNSNYTVVNGGSIVVAGVNPAGYNGTHPVTASAAGSVSFVSTETGAFVSGGAISGSYSVEENGGDVRLLYLVSTGPLPGGSGFGVYGYGEFGYGTGTAPITIPGTPINADDWTFDNFGEILIACPLNGPIYFWNPTSGVAVSQAIPNAPSVNAGAFVAMPQRQVIAWGSSYTGVQDPLQIRWSDVNNFNDWTATLLNQAGGYRIPNASRIVQCVQGSQQALVWTDINLWAMQYVGPPYVYQFNQIGVGCGLIGRRAAGSINNIIYWMSQNQFFLYTSNGVEPLKCPIWDVAFQDLDRDYIDNIRVAPNSYYNEIAWYYPVTGSNGVPTRYVKYNIGLDQWDFGTLTRTAWINQSVVGQPIGAGSDQYLYQHETSVDADGQPMTSYFQTGYFAMSEADVKMFVDQVWPDMKWGYYGGPQGANIKITFYVTDYPGISPSSSSPPAVAYGPFTVTQATEFITPRFRGRLVSIRVESDEIGSFWRLGNIRYRYQIDGKY